MPIGTIIAYSGSDPPTGWLLCNGEAVPPGEEFKKLRDEVRTNFGTNLAGQPLLPDLQGRVPLGSGKGEGLSQRTIGESLGKEKHTLTAAEMPKHDHEIRTAGRINHQIGGKPGIGWGDYKDVPSGLAGGLQNTLNGQGEPHNNMQPYLVVNFIIKAK
nr:tail fiber protein [Acanthopleuribacter pedis]